MSRRATARLRVATPACLVAGLALMLPFDAPVTLALGAVLLLAFVGCGLVLIAGPGAPTLEDDRGGV